MITILIDCHAAVYRAYYSTGNLATKGNSTGIPFGFFWSLLLLAERFHSNRFIFCWDSSRLSRRRDLWCYYKADRRNDLTDEERAERGEIHKQIEVLRDEILPSVGFNNNVQHEGFEADDLIAVEVVENRSRKYVAVSGDSDLFQLLRFNNFRLYNPTTNKLWTASNFLQEYEVQARDWVLVKSIAGCPTDGVPGVPGVAIKTAIRYINGTLPVGGKKYRDILANVPLFKRNYRLVSLPFINTPTTAEVEDGITTDKLFDFFGDCDFRSFLNRETKERWERFVKGEWHE